LTGSGEIALVDVREQGEYAKGHILLSCCIPLSRFELLIRDLIPRYATPVVLVDDGPAERFRRSDRARERLSAFGYTNLSILEGGIGAWEAAGFELFSGVNVVSKAFGEFVEAAYGTPRIEASELHRKLESSEPPAVFDARPEEEFYRMNIPGALNVPGAELVHRFFGLVSDPSLPVVVNCAGRTRSILGTQSLINAGVPNPVAALKNGTMGWHLAGYRLEHGSRRPAPPPSAEALEKAAACAARVADRFGVERAAPERLQSFLRDAERTLYLLDVRLPEEYRAGHPIGSRNAPGGQLIQATDEYAPVRNARLVLVDDIEVRAVTTASWLIQMGWRDVFVLSGGVEALPRVEGIHAPEVAGYRPQQTLSARELKKMLDARSPHTLIDLGDSRRYRQGHIPRAAWAVRSRLPWELPGGASQGRIVLTSTDGVLAHLAAADLKYALPEASVFVLEGGTAAWSASGFPLEQGSIRLLSSADDVWYKPYEHKDAPESAMQAYLDWEVALLEKIERDGTLAFRRFP
jgi:rhodanese-related sulfurtransferase